MPWLDDDPEAEAERQKYRDATKGQTPLEVADARPPEYSDEALALRFSAKHADDARYVALWGKWLLWDGSRWRLDQTMRSFDLARAICRVASAEIDEPKKVKLAAQVASAKTVAAIVTLARADRRHAALAEQFDADPWLFSAGSATVELRSGTVREPRREDYFTKQAAVSPSGDCPRWQQFLTEITGDEAELKAYLQRVAGYCLTGVTTEHAMFFCYGTGANGKSVFINTIGGIWGDYSVTAPMETFTVTRGDSHPTDLAMLRGARLVIAQETEAGRRWAESKIKALTGGDQIAARFMRQDFFNFTPQFKLLIAGNHKPGLRGVDEAIRRRLHLIPFAVTIPPERRDPKLPERLRLEWPGILQWAIEGCLEWQRIGLAPPAAVRNATAEYLAGEDAITNWIDDCCERDRRAMVKRSALFENWKTWAAAAGEFPGRQKEFFAALESRGFVQHREPGTGQRMFRGLSLKPADTLL
ncbi:MAG TPA: phage/plasmid primase, P4 family [Stellaceae bacterium]|nr:phage/plasmid primase, P4 family [Stellaceae bacterium]